MVSLGRINAEIKSREELCYVQIETFEEGLEVITKAL